MNNLYSLQNLFNEKVFRVPDYQRGYSWGKEQLIEFWEDLLNIPDGREHYTGMISLQEIKDVSDEKWDDDRWLLSQGYKFYHVIDGQQRIATFVILISEIVKFVKNLPENKGKSDSEINIESITLKEIKDRYLFKNYPNNPNILKSYKFGYEVDNPSYTYFKNKILEEETIGMVEETFYTLNLKYAKNFFRKHIKELYEEYKDFECINKLFFNLTQRLKFNIYYIGEDFNEFITFETMNNRGKKLSYLELLKNRLIYLTTLFKMDEEDEQYIPKKVRRRINDTWKDIYSYLGKNKREPLDDDEFLRAHWIIYFGHKSREENYFDSFLLNKYFIQSRVIENEFILKIKEEDIERENRAGFKNRTKDKLKIEDISNYVDSLRYFIPYWYAVYYPEDTSLNDDIKEWLLKLDRINPAYFRPVICAVIANKKTTDEEKLEFLKATERYIFIHFKLYRYSPNYQRTVFYNFARDLYRGEKTVRDIINHLSIIGPLDENGEIFFLSETLKTRANQQCFYTWGSIRYFLYEYELYLKGDIGTDIKLTPEAIFTKNKRDQISVEHIYPQSGTNEYWQEKFGHYPEKARFFLTHTLGNLLPLSQSINSSLQNDSFDDKKYITDRRPRAYENGCYSEMEVAKYNEWNYDSIKDRGLKMLDFLEKRWRVKFKEGDKLKVLYFDRIDEGIAKANI